LVQFAKEPVDEWGVPSDAVPTHAMELRPYIEEPTRRILPPSYVNVNHHPKIRHDFVLSKQEFVGAYWETLEYCYLTAGFAEPLSAFPGCSVPEVCNHCYTSLQYYLIVVTLYFWSTCYHFKWSYAFFTLTKNVPAHLDVQCRLVC
jgi:general transcription factor 3C polypeptide 1